MQVERAKKEQDQKEIPTIDDVMLKETVRNGKKSLLSTLFSTSWLWKCAAVPLTHQQSSATHAPPAPGTGCSCWWARSRSTSWASCASSTAWFGW